MPSPLAEAFLMGILNGCYETPSKGRIGIILNAFTNLTMALCISFDVHSMNLKNQCNQMCI